MKEIPDPSWESNPGSADKLPSCWSLHYQSVVEEEFIHLLNTKI